MIRIVSPWACEYFIIVCTLGVGDYLYDEVYLYRSHYFRRESEDVMPYTAWWHEEVLELRFGKTTDSCCVPRPY